MNESGMIETLLNQWNEIPVLEAVGVLFAVVQVHLAKRNNPWLYFFGIISVSITMYLLWTVGLYAEFFLNAYYLVMSLYGWSVWLGKGKDSAVNAGYASRATLKLSFFVILLGGPLMWALLVKFTDSDVAAWDAWVSITACVGMWLLAKRRIENWIFLNISNAFAVPLLWHKGLMLYALLTVYLFVIAILGYRQWRKLIRESTSNPQN